MRTFKCYDCGHTWQFPYGEGGRGVDLKCPECGCANVHREDTVRMETEPRWEHRGWGRRFGGGRRR
jgi:hypothetical protein